MSKHTPGPWKCNREGLITKDDRYGLHIAQVATVGMGYAIQPNAHLIAAAPAMYEALKMARWLSNECECHESWNAPEGNLCGHCTADLAIKTALSQAEGK